MAFGIQEEWKERKFPTPDEWSFVTRKDYRSARWAEDHESDSPGPALVDWALTGGIYRRLLARLEDPKVDGASLQEQGDDQTGILVAGVGKTGFDISAKAEPWRRGYYEVLMGCARAAEHLDGWVRDKTRNIAFPENVVIGPSNPDPRPVPPGAKSAPNEEDCEPAFDTPDVYYLRILTTNGFTEKQRIDAALAYGTWLDYKNTHGAAEEMYKWGFDIATSGLERKTVGEPYGIINTNTGAPSANVLSAATALAIHYATNSQLQTALPIFLSILRSRRQLPEAPKTMLSTLNNGEEAGWMKTLSDMAASIIVPPSYPSPPPDGTYPPQRDAKELCEEAGVMAYIGEILFASNSANPEDGLAWTREAVDVAEEQLRRISTTKEATSKNITLNSAAKMTCTQCLEVGLSNWNTMVSRMAREEKAANVNKKAGGWLGFSNKDEDKIGRWESEEAVIKERMRRAGELIGVPA
jgi:hypothetical protein